jgi:K+-transporting ATPase ATPase C chain
MKPIVTALKIFLILTILTGIIYPLFITGTAQLFFPAKANGSFLFSRGKAVGSELIGQQFDSAGYFTSRPSAISYNPLPSGGSNYGLTNIKLRNQVEERKQQFISSNQLSLKTEVPSEMFFASASGLDPHISPKAALLQVNRIAKSRHFNEAQKEELKNDLKRSIIPPQFGLFGEHRVNVLMLNINLDKIKP